MTRIPSPYQTDALPPIARASDPATSHAAARRTEPRRGSQMRTILYLFRAYPKGLTAKEVEAYLHMPGAWKRVSDLKAAGWIVGTGEERDGGEVYVAT